MNHETILNTRGERGRYQGSEYSDDAHTDNNPDDTIKTPQDRSWCSVAVSKCAYRERERERSKSSFIATATQAIGYQKNNQLQRHDSLNIAIRNKLYLFCSVCIP